MTILWFHRLLNLSHSRDEEECFLKMFVVILILMLINVQFDSCRVLIYHYYYRIYSLRHVSFAVSQYL